MPPPRHVEMRTFRTKTQQGGPIVPARHLDQLNIYLDGPSILGHLKCVISTSNSCVEIVTNYSKLTSNNFFQLPPAKD